MDYLTINQLPEPMQAIERQRLQELQLYIADEENPGFSEWYGQAKRVYSEMFTSRHTPPMEACIAVDELLKYFKPMMQDRQIKNLFLGPLDPEFDDDDEECPCCGCSCGGDF